MCNTKTDVTTNINTRPSSLRCFKQNIPMAMQPLVHPPPPHTHTPVINYHTASPESASGEGRGDTARALGEFTGYRALRPRDAAAYERHYLGRSSYEQKWKHGREWVRFFLAIYVNSAMG